MIVMYSNNTSFIRLVVVVWSAIAGENLSSQIKRDYARITLRQQSHAKEPTLPQSGEDHYTYKPSVRSFPTTFIDNNESKWIKYNRGTIPKPAKKKGSTKRSKHIGE